MSTRRGPVPSAIRGGNRRNAAKICSVRPWTRLALVCATALGLAAGAGAQVHYQPIASYRIEARLDPVGKTVEGEQTLVWLNTSRNSTSELWFHLYLNAFKNDRSTFAREQGGELWHLDGAVPADYWGSIDIESMDVLDAGAEPAPERIVAAQPIQPDDDNSDDETVLRVVLSEPVEPGDSIRLRLRFRSKLPRGIARTGWAEDYFFVAQWYPKLGVLEDEGWNCHQYHANTEYFADYGSYDVTVTVPSRFVVGGGGAFQSRDNQDGTTSHHFTQDRVHDFAWVASPRFLKKGARFSSEGLPPVDLVLLLLPEHESLGDRYLASAANALRLFGEWFGPYPYPVLTVVDPLPGSDTGGMEYPTFITGGTTFGSPPETLSPEGVTVHEVGHQWWFGMVASNEFEEAWLDEGINSWAEARAMQRAYPRAQFVARFLGGVPFVFPSMEIPFETESLSALRRNGRLDVMTEPSWRVRNSRSYVVNSYYKPEIVLWTLERLLGEERMLKGMRNYFQRRQFTHPKTTDFIEDVSQAAERDLSGFFQETFYSSELIDYSIESARSTRIPPIQGRESHSSLDSPDDASDGDDPAYLTEVVVSRNGGARLPVEVLMVFEDGRRMRESWDGSAPWRRFKMESGSRLLYATVDPDRKLALDVDPVNNSRWVATALEERDPPTVVKWTSKWFFWVQNLMETMAFLG